MSLRSLPPQGQVALLICLSVIGTEGLVRLCRPQEGELVRAYQKPDPDLGSLMRPNVRYVDRHGKARHGYQYTVRTNNLGLRMDSDVNASAPNAKVCLCGNSFVFGWGSEIEDTFYHHVASKMPGDADLLNCGHGAFSTGHTVKLLKQLQYICDVDTVIYLVSSADLLNNYSRNPDYRVYSYEAHEDGSVQLTPTQPYSPIKRFLLNKTPYAWLNQNSHCFVYLKKLVRNSRHDEFAAETPQIELQRTAGTKNDADLVDVTLAHIQLLKELCESRNTGLVLVWMPTLADLQAAPPPAITQLKTKLTERHETKFMDPTEDLKLAAREFTMEELFFSDGHLTATGNRIYGEVFNAAISDHPMFAKHRTRWLREQIVTGSASATHE